MGWQNDQQLYQAQQSGIEQQLFPDITPDEQIIMDALQKQNDQQINMLSVATNMSVQQLTALLFEMEMKGIVRTLAGGSYHLIMNG